MYMFDIRVIGTNPVHMNCTDGPFTMEDLQRQWPEYLVNWSPEFLVAILDNKGNVVRQEAGVDWDAMRRDWVTLEEWNEDKR